jgi:hypothetical protein
VPPNDTPEARAETQQEKVDFGLGRIVGGSYIGPNKEATLHEDHGPITEVDIDMPLTLTEVVQRDDNEYIVLSFAKGDCEVSMEERETAAQQKNVFVPLGITADRPNLLL